MAVAGAGEIADVLEEHHGWSTLLNDAEDVPVQRSTGFFHASLSTTLGERLAREAGAQNVVLRHRDAVIVRILGDVAERIDAPVPLVDSCGRRIDLDGIYAFPAHRRECGMEPSDPGEEINEGELWFCHEPSLDVACDAVALETLRVVNGVFRDSDMRQSAQCQETR